MPKMNFYTLANEKRGFINDYYFENWYFLRGIIKITTRKKLFEAKRKLINKQEVQKELE